MAPKRSPRKTAIRSKASPASSSPEKKSQAGFECQICFVVSDSQEDYVNHIIQAHTAAPRVITTKPEPEPEPEPEPVSHQSEVPTYEEIVQDVVEEEEDEHELQPEEEQEEAVEEEIQIQEQPEEVFNNSSSNQCPDCNKTYQTPSHYKRHRESKCGKEKKFSCNFCHSEFISESTLTTHLLIHGGEKKFSCTFCPKSFLSNGQLNVHLRQHTQEKPFECSVCLKTFSYRESLVTHSSIHTGIKPYQCLNCKNQFSCIGNLIKHRKTRQSTCGLPEFCKNVKIAPRPNTKIPGTLLMTPLRKKKKGQEEAPVTTSTTPTLPSSRVNKEKRTRKLPRIKTLSPELDPQVIYAPESEFIDTDGQEEGPSSQEYVVLEFDVDKAEIEEHQQEQEDQPEGESQQESHIYVVSEATAVTEEEEEESEHHPEHIVNGRIIDGYVINLVPDQHSMDPPAKKPRRQRIKTMTTTGEDFVYKCAVCFESFTSESGALAHKLNAHSDGGEEQSVASASKKTTAMDFNCNKCMKSFAVLRSLQKHVASGCGILLDHICPICEKSYATASTLRTHMSFHNNERPYNCEECMKRFRTPVQLSVHMRVHTGERPYKCKFDKCFREFAHRETLLTHESIHTGYKRFLCISCGDRFSCISNLQSHRRARKATCGMFPAHTRPVAENEDVKPLMINQ